MTMQHVMRAGDMRRGRREIYESLGQLLVSVEAWDLFAADVVFRRHISDFRGSIANQD
jgi:hypothetical protein